MIYDIWYRGNKLCLHVVFNLTMDWPPRVIFKTVTAFGKCSLSEPIQPIHSFLVGCLNPCLQETSVHVVLPQPFRNVWWCWTWFGECAVGGIGEASRADLARRIRVLDGWGHAHNHRGGPCQRSQGLDRSGPHRIHGDSICCKLGFQIMSKVGTP